MENTTKSFASAGVGKAKDRPVDEESELESDGSGEELSESSDEEPPPPPVRSRPPVRSNKQHNAIIRRIPHRDFLKQKRKSEALKEFHKFSKKMKLDTGLSIKTIAGGDIVELDELLSDSDESFTKEESESSDGFSDPEFTINPEAALEPDQGNESFIDPETGAITVPGQEPSLSNQMISEQTISTSDSNTNRGENKTLSISDIINEESELDLSKNVDIEEILGANQFTIEKRNMTMGDNNDSMTQAGDDAEYDITEKLKEMGEISVKPVKREDDHTEDTESQDLNKSTENPVNADGEDEKNKMNALNVRRNIREVMDEKQLDASTLAAQRQESERLARVQEQQRIIREVRRQIALGRQEKAGASLLKGPNLQKLNLPGTVLVKLPSGEMKKSAARLGQMDHLKVQKNKGHLTPSVSIAPVGTAVKKEVVEIVDSSSSSSSSSESPSSDSDDCIMLSDSELPPSPEPEEDPQNSGLHVNDAYNLPDEQGRVVINIGHPENEEDIFLAPQIGRIIKPHQIGGVRFLFDNIIESVERFSTSTGFGCILAHSMGLGKTLQIVCFCDIFLRHTKSKTVLCIMPINTLQNWVAEFNMWLPLDPSSSTLSMHGEVRSRNFPIYVLNDSHKTLQARAKVIQEWTNVGGVLMIGYELYRLLSMKKNKKPRNRKKPPGKSVDGKDKLDSKDGEKSCDSTKQTPLVDGDKKLTDVTTADGLKCDEKVGKEEDEATKNGEDKDDDEEPDEEKKLLDHMFDALVKPGPDLVICDEGHRIKNSHSNISYALKQMRTKRRIVLTGYPLQNNLLEYWCMVDFVRPNYLGTKTEFSNMFERPIQNGQCIDSTPQDIRLMRYRAHVLHSLLVGFVQRRSHAVLQSTLPQKEEYVLLVRMTDLQRKLYDTFMNEVVRKKTVPNPLKAFAVCCKIWNHPDVLYYFLKKREEMAAMIDYDLDLEDANPTAASGVTNSKNKAGSTTKKGKPRSRATPKKGNDKTPLAPNTTNSGKPAATIPPNTSNANPVTDSYNSYDSNKGAHPNGAQYSYGQDMNQPNTYPPPYGYQPHPQQYPQQNYYGQNDSYTQPYSSGGYYPPQPYGAEYNHYNPTNTQDQNSSSAPPPQQNYPHNPGYTPQGYWGPDNNYYNNTNSDYYHNPSHGHTGFQSNQDSYNSVYDPYAQQTQPYHGFNHNRTYDRNAPNGEHGQQGFGNAAPSDSSYQAAVGGSAPPFPVQPSSDPSAPSTYDSSIYPGYQNAQPVPGAQEKPHTLGISPETPSWPIPSNEPVPKSSINNYNNVDIKSESKTDSDGDFKIADLDTMKVIKDIKPEIKQENKLENVDTKKEVKEEEVKDVKLIIPEADKMRADKSEERSQIMEETSKNKDEKEKHKKTKEKSKPKDRRGKKGGKTSKDKSKNDNESGKDSDEDKKDKDDSELRKIEMKEEVPYEWANDLLKVYMPGIIENSAKMEIFFCILIESIRLGDRLLLFSQSLFTLNLIEDFLQRNYIPGTDVHWAKNKSYYRLDGSTSALEREKLINEFNSNPNIHLFLVSTRAGSLGINLVGANRVIVFDASWNPCHDTQAVCRVYRYGQKKPCFVYRLVMDNCLEKKIYDRQINKQGMADRVVDECNPDAVLSMKEVTNLCWDSEEKETETKEFEKGCKEKYLDVIMRKVIEEHARTLSKEPFQHESLLVDRKEKKLSSAEKRLAQRGYELEKKAAANPKPSLMYRTIRTADGTIIQRPVASVRPMQHGGAGGARWIPAEVWQRQGMTAQEMTLPLDVVIPTNSAEKSNIVLKAGQRVMVLKSPKGIYMQLESGKIIAIKTSFKVGQNKSDGTPGSKEGGNSVKKVIPSRPSNLPGSLKNNSAITVISKGGRTGIQKLMTRPAILHNKVGGSVRPFAPGQRIQEIKIRSAAPNIASRPVSLIRGRAPPRPARPIPIQNKLNIKIQGANSLSITNTSEITEPKIVERDVTEGDGEFNLDLGNSNSNQSSEASRQTPKVETGSEQGIEQSNDSSDAFEAGVVPNKALQPTLPEDVVSEDSSQEKTYVDLSDKSESKITTKPSTKKSPVKPASPAMKDCKIPIKNSFLHSDPVTMGFMNEVTIKRTSVPPKSSSTETTKPGPVNLLADEVFPSEATLSEHKLPSSQTSLIISADENSMEEDLMFKEKKIYRPNLVDRKIKINSLKNYRHPKSMQKPISIQSDFSMSPASTSSTPTPPPVTAPVPCSLSQLEKTASAISRSAKPGGMSDFQQSLSEITKTYSPGSSDPSPTEQPVYKPGPKSRKKKPPPTAEASSPDNTEVLSKPIPIDTSLVKLNIPNSQPTPSGAPYPHPQGYGESSGLSAGFADPSFHQQPAMAVDPAMPPQQPYNTYPGYPPGSGTYPPYPGAPYYPQYPPAPYPAYPQYPPYPPNPYPGYPPQW